MTRTLNSPPPPERGTFRPVRPTRRERATVLGSFALAALVTVVSAVTGAGLEPVAAAWIAAAMWAFFSSLVFALLRGFRRGGLFRRKLRQRKPNHRKVRKVRKVRSRLPEDTELIDWSTQSGAWLDMVVAEENERLMRGG